MPTEAPRNDAAAPAEPGKRSEAPGGALAESANVPVNVLQRSRCSCREKLAVRCAADRQLVSAACMCRCHTASQAATLENSLTSDA